MHIKEDEDDKKTILDDLDNLDNDTVDDEVVVTDADDAVDDEPTPSIVDMFVNGDIDKVKDEIHNVVVNSVSKIVNHVDSPVEDDDEDDSSDDSDSDDKPDE